MNRPNAHLAPFSSLSLLVCLLASTANAATFTEPIFQGPGYQAVIGAMPDQGQGAIVVWADYDDLSAVHAQRVTRGGATLWGPGGVRIPTPGNYDAFHLAWAFGDGQGWALIVWQEFNADWPRPAITSLQAQRIDAHGRVQWDTLGISLCKAANTRYSVRFVPDGTGGGLFAWMDHRNGALADPYREDYLRGQWRSGFDVFAQKIDARGNTSWGPGGLAIRDTTSWGDIKDILYGGNEPSLDMVPDGSGGAVLVWPDRRNPAILGRDIYAQRLDASGTALWDRNGVPVFADTGWTQLSPRVASDGHGGAVVAWLDERPPGLFHVYAQRLDSEGLRLWDLGGLRVSTDADIQWSPSVVSDGKDGAIIAWASARVGSSRSCVQRIDASGTVRWGHTGIEIAPYLLGDSPTGDGGMPLLSDGLGGALCVGPRLDSKDSSLGFLAQNVDVGGELLWGPQGLPLPPWKSPGFPRPSLVPSGGGMFVFWSGGDVYGTYVSQRGFESLTDVPSLHPQGVASISPNPLRTSAELSITLDQPGRLRATVVDLQGRAVRCLIDRDETAGWRQISFDGRDDGGALLRSGVYFLRVSTPAATTTKAFVITR